MLVPRIVVPLIIVVASNLLVGSEAGIIKDIYQKITHTNNKTEETVKQSAPICGSGTFSTPDEKTLSPEIIFITNRPSKASTSQYGHESGPGRDDERSDSSRRRDEVSEVAREFRFHEENVTLADLERHGFNRDAPVSFLMHGFTSGYPLQAWISAIVEAYTIDRQQSTGSGATQSSYQQQQQQHQREHNYATSQGYQSNRDEDRSRDREGRRSSSGNRVNHNLFIINWNFAARGILYPRAVANIPIVASYVTRFVNDKLLGEARVDPRRVQLIGHSLGAHLAGFIGKNTRSKLGRIYGLDPAGPCFGTISGPLYPASKRLAPTDAEEVITIHTNTALLGIEKPIGKYSVYVEGGSVQPGCKGGGVLKSLQTLTWDGGDFDTIACSHSRAPNLLTYRHTGQSPSGDDECQLVAYECKNWDSFVAGHCGVCGGDSSYSRGSSNGPLRPVECLRVGLDWQYAQESNGQSSGFHTTRRPNNNYDDDHTTKRNPYYPGDRETTRRPSSWNNGTQSHQQYSTSAYGDNQYSSTRRPTYGGQQSTSSYGNQNDEYSTRRPYGLQSNAGGNHQNNDDNYSSSNPTRRPTYGSGQNSDGNYPNQNGYQNQNGGGRGSTRRPTQNQSGTIIQRDRRDSNETSERRANGERNGESKILFMRTGDTQPYCAYQYQVVLELNEPFGKKKPPMSLVLQDSESNSQQHHQAGGQNSLSNDEFGNKFDDRTYTHLLTSSKKLGRIDHATLLFREGLPDGLRQLKALHVNYMSHIDPNVRRRHSATLCPVRKNPGQGEDFSTDKRFYFEPCTGGSGSSVGGQQSGQQQGGGSSSERRPKNDRQK